jgi:ATP-dependent Clp protease protease subunit
MLVARKTSIRSKSNKKEIQNKNSEATVYLYGDIGGWFGIESQEWIKEFNAIDAGTIHLRVDSSGGDIFSARSMKTAIMQHPAKVIAHVDGLAASAASFLIMGADEIEIVDGGFIMIHNALSFIDFFGYFNIEDINKLISDMEREKELHSKINDSIASDYVKKSGVAKETVMGWMDAETWFTAQEAVDNKFADRIYDATPVEGSYDLTIFSNVPESVENRNKNVPKRALERALRDAGLSNKEAKRVLAEGFQVVDRDDPTPEDIQPVEPQRDVEEPEPRKDRITELLILAERMAPSTD